jgi:hypothetical protein
MKTYRQIGAEIGELVTAKNAAYGSSVEAAPQILRILYPQGIAPGQMLDALLIVRILDKLKRIATNRDALGESPYMDIAGYGILGSHLHQKESAETCASVSGPSAVEKSKAMPGSAARSTSGSTTTSASAKSESVSTTTPCARSNASSADAATQNLNATNAKSASPRSDEAARLRELTNDIRAIMQRHPREQFNLESELALWAVRASEGSCPICGRDIDNPWVVRMRIGVFTMIAHDFCVEEMMDRRPSWFQRLRQEWKRFA